MSWFRKKNNKKPPVEQRLDLGVAYRDRVQAPIKVTEEGEVTLRKMMDTLPPPRRRPTVEIDADEAESMFDQLGADDAGVGQTPSSAALRGDHLPKLPSRKRAWRDGY